MAERSNASVLKTDILRGIRGSNPCLSAITIINISRCVAEVASQAHNLKVNGSNPFSATINLTINQWITIIIKTEMKKEYSLL